MQDKKQFITNVSVIEPDVKISLDKREWSDTRGATKVYMDKEGINLSFLDKNRFQKLDETYYEIFKAMSKSSAPYSGVNLTFEVSRYLLRPIMLALFWNLNFEKNTEDLNLVFDKIKSQLKEQLTDVSFNALFTPFFIEQKNH
jgi:hypothetical protein